MKLDMQSIMWIAWGSAVIIPIKIYLIIRYFKRKIAEDVAKQTQQDQAS
ncbi:hypothetical protein [Magnetococcus marinus]|nr:hypothetical protein [Magnetococcus marinus]